MGVRGVRIPVVVATLASLVLLIVPGPTLSCTPLDIALSKAQRAHYADVIFVGKVLATYLDESFSYGSNTSVYTATMKVYCIYKGDVKANTVNVTQAGSVPGMCFSANLKKDSEYMVYLRQHGLQIIDSEIDNTEQFRAEVTKACGLQLSYPPGVSAADLPHTCPEPASADDCVPALQQSDHDMHRHESHQFGEGHVDHGHDGHDHDEFNHEGHDHQGHTHEEHDAHDQDHKHEHDGHDHDHDDHEHDDHAHGGHDHEGHDHDDFDHEGHKHVGHTHEEHDAHDHVHKHEDGDHDHEHDSHEHDDHAHGGHDHDGHDHDEFDHEGHKHIGHTHEEHDAHDSGHEDEHNHGVKAAVGSANIRTVSIISMILPPAIYLLQ